MGRDRSDRGVSPFPGGLEDEPGDSSDRGFQGVLRLITIDRPSGTMLRAGEVATECSVGGVTDVDFGGDPVASVIRRTASAKWPAGMMDRDQVHRRAARPTRSESLPPRNPGAAAAASTSEFRASELFSKSSRLEA